MCCKTGEKIDESIAIFTRYYLNGHFWNQKKVHSAFGEFR